MVTFAAIKKAQSGQSDSQRRATAARTTFNSSGKQISGPTYNNETGAQTGDLGTPDYLKATPTTQPIEPITPTPELSPALQPPAPTAAAITPKEALANAQASGVPAPQDSGEARSQMQQFMPGPTFYKPSAASEQVYDATGKALSYDDYIKAGGLPDFSNVQAGMPQNAITQQIEADPGYQQILADRAEYESIVNQRMSLTDEYTALTKKLGIDALNTELMNMKNIIEGTEEDIRTEVTKAGGFATESQVQALTMARNKQLVKNYNNLLETKQMAMQTLDTMIGLAAQDRQFAQQAALQKLNIDQQIYEYQERMRNNAASQYGNLINTVGYSGLMAMTGGDPWQMGLIEKSLGLNPGGLAQLASLPGPRDNQVITAGGRSLLIDKNSGDVLKDFGSAYKGTSGGGGGGGSRTKKITIEESTVGATSYLSQSVGSDGKVSPETWQLALNAWLDDGHDTKEFVDRYENYVNKSYDGWKNNYNGF